MNNNVDFSYEIYDLNGRLIQQAQQVSTSNINVSSISNGLYLLKLTAEGKTATKKLVINH